MTAAVIKKKKQVVWYIARFKQRYEYRDDKSKKGGLQYTRAFVTAGPDIESRHFLDQLDDIKECKNWLEMTGALDELIRKAANDVLMYRGYLLHKRQPADTEIIARWLGVTKAKCQKILEGLEKFGFIVSVPFPDFPENSGNSQKNLEKPTKKKTNKKQREKKRIKRNPKTNPNPKKKRSVRKISLTARKSKQSQRPERNPKHKLI